MIMVWERLKAWRRGEKKVKGANRGRCFEKANPENNSKAQPKIKVSAKIIRADGTIENPGEI